MLETVTEHESPHVKPSETLLIDYLPHLAGTRVLCTSLGRAQLAERIATERAGAEVTCNFLDLYLAQQARAATAATAQLNITCESDLPAAEYDLAALPVSQSGDAELTRELLQQAYHYLTLGGRLVTATDNPRDSWLHEEMRRFSQKVTRLDVPGSGKREGGAAAASGVVYSLVKTAPLKKLKSYECEFAFRDDEQLLRVVTRPSVFSHRKIDTGARSLIEMMKIGAGHRVFDIGCGSGVVALAAATRAAGTSVYAIDSNPRAIECTRRSAELNGLANVRAELNADGACDEPGSYDVALANPPYYSHHKITEIFLDGARRALKSGGRLYVVTKHAGWYEENMPKMFSDVMTYSHRGYVVLLGTKR
jgi:predicted RNA methylase